MPPKSENSTLSHTPSGRDKNTAKATRDPLGVLPVAIPSPYTATSTSYHLVVCGAINAECDGFIFADFMAFCKYLSDKNMGGTFLSCFPIDKNFGVLSSMGINDIKFRANGVNNETLLAYTRFQHTYREQWWEDVRSFDLKIKVLDWIANTAQRAKPGDIVNIIFESHGHPHLGLRLGDHWLSTLDFSHSLQGFALGVQVNAISGACYGGRFREVIQASGQSDRYVSVACSREEVAFGTRSVSNRCRDSRYEHAWVQTLAKLRAFGDLVSPDPPARTVQEHEQYIRDNIHQSFPPASRPQNTEFFVSEPITLGLAIERLIVRDKIDVIYDRQITHRRRRIEWPSENSHFLDTINHIQQTHPSPSPQMMQEAIELLELEASKSFPDLGLPCDIPVFQFWLTKNPQYISERLQALYYRGRIQSTLLDTFTVLIQRGFITLDSLRKPIALWTGSDAVSTITDLLTTFDALAKEIQFDIDNKKPHPLWESYTMFEATNWLSTLIARGCADVATLFETIEVSGYLGGRNTAAFERYQGQGPKRRFECNAGERAAAEGTTPMSYFGFWLPHGLGNKSENEIHLEIMSCIERFDNIERVYKSFFNVPDDTLLRADQQAKYFEENPSRCSAPLSKYFQNEAAYRKAVYSRNAQSGTLIPSGGF